MDDRPDDPGSPRVPTRTDLVRVARALNEHDVEYVVIGGLAMAHHGLVRATKGIDLLVDPGPENVERIRAALAILEDAASLEVRPTDLEDYNVVRVADEIVVDLLRLAAGLPYAALQGEREWEEIDGVPIPFLSAPALLRTKETTREQDAVDRRHLHEVIRRGAEG